MIMQVSNSKSQVFLLSVHSNLPNYTEIKVEVLKHFQLILLRSQAHQHLQLPQANGKLKARVR